MKTRSKPWRGLSIEREGSVSLDDPQQTLVEALEKGSAGHDDPQQTLFEKGSAGHDDPQQTLVGTLH